MTTAQDLLQLLRKKYPKREYVVLTEVPNATGYAAGRWIDAAVFSLWPSNGLDRAAFEIKVSRSDFIREVMNPVKHKWVRKCFHQFWILAPLEVLENSDELPPGAGFMYPRGESLCVKRACTRNPEPVLNEVLLAAFMRATDKMINDHVEAEIRGNKDVVRGKMFENAVDNFLVQRRIYELSSLKTQEDIIAVLERATMDRVVKEDAEHLLAVSADFQQRMTGLFRLFAAMANRALLERDKMGEYIATRYKLKDDYSLAELRKDKKFQGEVVEILG